MSIAIRKILKDLFLITWDLTFEKWVILIFVLANICRCPIAFRQSLIHEGTAYSREHLNSICFRPIQIDNMAKAKHLTKLTTWLSGIICNNIPPNLSRSKTRFYDLNLDNLWPQIFCHEIYWTNVDIDVHSVVLLCIIISFNSICIITIN